MDRSRGAHVRVVPRMLVAASHAVAMFTSSQLYEARRALAEAAQQSAQAKLQARFPGLGAPEDGGLLLPELPAQSLWNFDD